ncbi:hypothetical protein CVT24_009512 [Panaeolus cyanescens]|uniref:TEA domain-containing protein n=1 Tax=Panaeolus cyanescens TaxID=181874 RepID=A0A409VYB8_9AGAR|nr:hypothetical protein CVT24_009512 [Panaeolus cyanescens]
MCICSPVTAVPHANNHKNPPLRLDERTQSDALHRSNTITLSTKKQEDETETQTVRGLALESAIDTAVFQGFDDFDLDLSCLSAPSSPVASTSHLPPSSPSPSPPSSPILSRSISFASHLQGAQNNKEAKRTSSTYFSSDNHSSPRGSWPLIKYAGRGTPIDRNRRMEWGGILGEEVAEDGLLFSSSSIHARGTSIDSAPRISTRSASPESSYVPRLSSTFSHSSHGSHLSRRMSIIHEPVPNLSPIQIDGLGSDKSGEWDSIMKEVLSSATPSSEEKNASSSTDPEEPAAPTNETEEASGAISDTPAVDIAILSQEQVEQLNADLGLNAALDLGLGQSGGMDWFKLGMLPKSARGHDSPSVYSSQTPRTSPPPSIHASEHRSATASTKAETANDTNKAPEPKSSSHPWWRRILSLCSPSLVLFKTSSLPAFLQNARMQPVAHSLPSPPTTPSTQHGHFSMSPIDNFSHIQSHSERTGRRTFKTSKEKKEAVWPPLLEDALIEGLSIYRPASKSGRKLRRFTKRNCFISKYIMDTTGKHRTPKQVGSRIQQIHETTKDPHLIKLITCRDFPREDESADDAQTSSPTGSQSSLEAVSPTESQFFSYSTTTSTGSVSPVSASPLPFSTLENGLDAAFDQVSLCVELMPTESGTHLSTALGLTADISDKEVDFIVDLNCRDSVVDNSIPYSARKLSPIPTSSLFGRVPIVTINVTGMPATRFMSTFTVWRDRNVPIHSEETRVTSQSMGVTTAISTAVLPSYWSKLSQRGDIERFTIIHELSEVSNRPDFNRQFSMAYNFKIVSPAVFSPVEMASNMYQQSSFDPSFLPQFQSGSIFDSFSRSSSFDSPPRHSYSIAPFHQGWTTQMAPCDFSLPSYSSSFPSDEGGEPSDSYRFHG